MKGRLLLTFDYELKKGADQGWGGKRKWGLDDYKATKKLLKLLKEYEIKATFYCLGWAGMPGGLPYHCAKQIKQMDKEGHEIGSHSVQHKYLANLQKDQLKYTLRTSKSILEKVIGKEVTSFSPPYNLPAFWPGKGAISFKEGWVKNSIPSICRMLYEIGYKTFRVLYVTALERLIGKTLTHQPVSIHGITCFRLSCRGWDYKQSARAVDEAVSHGRVAVIYDHAHCLNIEQFIPFLEYISKLKNLKITTPGGY